MLGLLLNRLMRKGTLTVIHSSGKMEAFGQGVPDITIKFHDTRAIPELVLNPDLKLGELYMDGRLTVENGGTIYDLLDLLMMNLGATHPTGLHKLARTFRHDGQVVFQVQLVKNQHALPITRDYMVDNERTVRFAGTEQMPAPPLRLV